MEDTTVDEVIEANVADEDTDDPEVIARKTKSNGYVEQDNL